MKRISFFLIALLIAATGGAQTGKVVQTSAKKAPAWLGISGDGYLTVEGYGTSLAAAQSDALQALQLQIAMAIATHVHGETSNSITSVTSGSSTSEADVFTSQMKATASNLPFLKGISLANAPEQYWQKYSDGKYVLHVHYPFTDAQQRALIAQFESYVAEKEAELRDLANAINCIEDVKDINVNKQRVQALKGAFVDPDHLAQVNALEAQYAALYKYLTVACTWTGLGECTVQLLLNGNPVKAGIAPKVTLLDENNDPVEGITLKLTNVEGNTQVSFDTQDLNPDDGYKLNIVYSGIPGCSTAPKTREPLSIKSGAFDQQTRFLIVPTGRIALSAAENVSGKLKDITIVISLNNIGGTPYKITGIELNVPELAAPINFEESCFADGGVYRTKGIKRITALCEGTFDVLETSRTSYNHIKGSINVVNPETNAVESLQINLPYSKNW